jgi:serine phosphatase RsbU (regulator of sigma subunit)
LLLVLGLLIIFARFNFFLLVEIIPGRYIVWVETMWSVLTWSAIWIVGPGAFWAYTLWVLGKWALAWSRTGSVTIRWNISRSMVFDLTQVVLAGLVALRFYTSWGGVFPLPGLDWPAVFQALLAIVSWWVLSMTVWAPYVYILISFWETTNASSEPMLRLLAFVFGLHSFVAPFGVLGAGLYIEDGVWVFLFFISAALFSSVLAHYLSRSAERGVQRTRELENLELLGRAIIGSTPDSSELPQLLDRYVPGMFPQSQVEIVLFPDQILLRRLEDGGLLGNEWMEWVRESGQPAAVPEGARLPWNESKARRSLLVAPILDAETEEAVGSIYLSPRWKPDSIDSLMPAAQSLAAQIASALLGAEVFKQTLAQARVEQELTLAGQIQNSLLPKQPPKIQNWSMVATLEPARETSGDFYDIILLPNGRIALVVADVADKGMGAALYMALSRTLIRTYAVAYPTRPDFVMRVVNQRILKDTQADLFVTVFYALFDPITGQVKYCNAGHNPPYIVRADSQQPIERLTRTGMAVGVMEDATWGQKITQLQDGDALVVFTDGIVEAQTEDEQFFTDERLSEIIAESRGLAAETLQERILQEVHTFIGDAHPFDDITLLVVSRRNEDGSA